MLVVVEAVVAEAVAAVAGEEVEDVAVEEVEAVVGRLFFVGDPKQWWWRWRRM